MLHFDNPTIHLRRPVIVTSVAQSLGVKPFELLAELIPMQVFVAPHQGLDDDTVFRLGERIGVDFRIDEDDGSNPILIRPIGPIPPAPRADHERQELLTVEHHFYIDRPGVKMLVLSPHFHMPKTWKENGWRERQEQVTVVRPDGSELPATAQINVTHLNIRDPDVPIEARWPITVWLIDRTPEEVPVGSKILVDPAVREAIIAE